MYLICNWRPDKKLAKFVWSSQCPHVDWLLREVDGSDGGKEEGFVPEKGDDHHGAQGDGAAVVVAWRALTLSFYSSRFVAKLASTATASRCFCLTVAGGGGSYQPHVHEVGSTRPSHWGHNWYHVKTPQPSRDLVACTRHSAGPRMLYVCWLTWDLSVWLLFMFVVCNSFGCQKNETKIEYRRLVLKPLCWHKRLRDCDIKCCV